MPTTQQFDNATLLDNPFRLQSAKGELSSQTNPGVVYKVSASSSSNSLNARLSLTNLTGNALLNLYDGSRKLIASSNQPSSLSESILYSNVPGTYYIEVGLDPSASSATYQLNAEFNTTGEFTNIFWRNLNLQQAAIWQMSGNTRLSGNTLNGLDAGWQAQGFADFNGDGEDDIVWQNRNSGEVAFSFLKDNQIVSSESIAGPPLSWRIAHTGHLNADKYADLVWQETTGTASVWLMQGSTRQDAALQPSAPDWSVQQVADLNGDKKDDLVWRSTNGHTSFVLMNGKDIQEQGSDFAVPPEWKIKFLGDLNKDGSQDVVWRNDKTGVVSLWLMDGTSRVAFREINAGLGWDVAATGDFNGDGKADLLWRSVNGDNSIALMDGLTTLSDNALQNVPGDWKVVQASDFNGDGKADLLWRSENSKAATVWLMDGTKDTSNTVARLKDSNGVVANNVYEGIDASWTIQSVLHRDLTAQPFSISGAAPETAFDIGILDDKGVYSDKISLNENDFYKFSVGIKTDLTASLTQAGALELYQNVNGAWVKQTYTAGSTVPIEKGDYYIKVSAAPNVTTATDYTLNIQGVPRRIDLVGTAFTSPTSYALSNVPQTGSPADNKVDVTFQIKNLETFAASDFTVSFYISRDTEIDPNDTTPIRGDRQLDIALAGNTTQATISGKDLLVQKSLGKNGTFDGTVTLTLPGSLDGFWTVDKPYYIGMAINLSGRQNETNPNDNFNVALSQDKSEVVIQNVPTTDLRGASLTGVSTADTLQQGSEVNLTYQVENLGNKPTSKNVQVSFYASLDSNIDPNKDYGIDVETLSQIIGTKSSTGNLKTLGAMLPTKDTWNDLTNLFGRTKIYLGMYVNSDITNGPTESDTSNNLNRGVPYDLIETYIDLGSQN